MGGGPTGYTHKRHPPPPPRRSIEQYDHATVVPGVLVVRLDAPAYFANVQYFQDKLGEYEEEALE